MFVHNVEIIAIGLGSVVKIVGKNTMIETSTDVMRYLARRFFDNKCFVTHETFKDKGFVIHHIFEIEHDVLRSQFAKGEKGRYEYLRSLKSMVEDRPERFALIKNGIHTKLDHKRNGVTRLKMENRKRFCDLALRTIHRNKSKGKRKK